MGIGYIPHPCSKCGYTHHNEHIYSGSGFVPIFSKLIFCKNCNRIGNITWTPEDVVAKLSRWETTSDYLEELRREWGELINIDEIKFDNTCRNCHSVDYVPLSIESDKSDPLSIAWLKCPICNEGRLKLKRDIIFD